MYSTAKTVLNKIIFHAMRKKVLETSQLDDIKDVFGTFRSAAWAIFFHEKKFGYTAIDKSSCLCYCSFCMFWPTWFWPMLPCYGKSETALVAQSVEHHHGKVGVAGSNPAEGSKSKTVYTEEIEHGI